VPVHPRLRLLRLPLAATTVADVWAGWFGGAALAFEPRLLVLHASSLALYFAGMTLNDVFDSERDRTIHPERPIPSGALTRGEAALQGALLLAIGVALAFAGGRLEEGLCLAAAVLAYDALLKRWPIPGALSMGLCRYLDVQVGAGFAAGALFPGALALGAYVAFVTLVSTLEDDPGRDRAAIGAWVRRLLLGIFLVDAAALLLSGRPDLAAAAALLAATFPLLARALGGRPAAPPAAG
jgi:4-hydroxybenzoate polyprenyltransferase